MHAWRCRQEQPLTRRHKPIVKHSCKGFGLGSSGAMRFVAHDNIPGIRTVVGMCGNHRAK
ncbi:Uncharacterised protein [Mycobacteroides abscessus subsp. bolletii]|nr:Uncharacterised protein [Mycobacteroides abscessus subsp. bolletii]SKN23613.1 Uncharacterised protein [Mycobacteroides abscessus subsp. bolletii]